MIIFTLRLIYSPWKELQVSTVDPTQWCVFEDCNTDSSVSRHIDYCRNMNQDSDYLRLITVGSLL
jgi:hypothetical protein